jgi:hypothetical protein
MLMISRHFEIIELHDAAVRAADILSLCGDYVSRARWRRHVECDRVHLLAGSEELPAAEHYDRFQLQAE